MIHNNEKNQYRMYVISSAILVAAVFLCLFASVQVVTKGYVSVGGYSVFRVVTGSMEPTIHTGSILINQKTDIEEIKKDDIVCFWAKNADIRGSIITHRVTEVMEDESGRIYLETRGDANLAADPYYADSTNLIGRVTWHSGKENVLTNMLSFLSGKIGFFACIVFPILLIAGLVLQSAVKNLQRDIMELRYELARGPVEEVPSVPDKDKLLPGYTTLTYEDYEAIYETLKRELLEELNGLMEEADSTTE